MSEKLFRFQLNELTTVRIHCASCSITLEIPIENLIKKFPRRSCPVCQEEYNHPNVGDDYNPFVDLAKLARFFKGVKDQVGIEFTLPDKE